MNHVDFNQLYFECRDQLPSQKLKILFDAALVGGMSAYVPDQQIRRIMELALDTAHNFSPQLTLVKG